MGGGGGGGGNLRNRSLQSFTCTFILKLYMPSAICSGYLTKSFLHHLVFSFKKN